MRNVTSEMQRFREASRHLWNTYLMPGEGVVDMVVEDSFRSIERELLRSLVLQGRGSAEDYGRAHIGGLSVKSKSNYDQVPVQFSSKGPDGNTYWSKSEFVSAAEISYGFLEFFDWMHFAFIDYGIVRAIDLESGRHVLLENLYCEFWLDE